MVALYWLISYYLVFAKSWQSGLNMKGKVQGFIQGGGGGGDRTFVLFQAVLICDCVN